MAQLATRTPAGGLPASGSDRVKVMLKAASEDELRGNLQSAETNLRLALAFAPSEPLVKQSLERVLTARELQRRKAAVR
ncbi:MAG: hypothetical protein Q8L14_38680 [Myxococcales bacterium]|nr:hypothetical protein [Myxococcales bacterium]